MIGAKRGVDGNLGTIIQVAADKTGIILPKNDTLGAGVANPDNPATKGANGSHIYGLWLESLGGTDQTKRGTIVRTAGATLGVRQCLADQQRRRTAAPHRPGGNRGPAQ